LLLCFLLRLLWCPIDHWCGCFKRFDLGRHVSVFEPWCTGCWDHTCQFSQTVPRISRTLREHEQIVSARVKAIMIFFFFGSFHRFLTLTCTPITRFNSKTPANAASEPFCNWTSFRPARAQSCG
jgi:hypothetical protein